MSNAFESANAKQGIASLLAAGLKLLSDDQTITFAKYIRLVLPLDGFVFWVKAQSISQGALLNAMGLNVAGQMLNSIQVAAAQTTTLQVQGSLHYSTQVRQEESETEAVNTVIFSAIQPVQMFNNIAPGVLWIATVEGDATTVGASQGFDGPITFAFSSHSDYYETADLYHYVGIAVLPTLKAQLIDGTDDLVDKGLWVSNSLSLILPLQQYRPPYWDGFSCLIPLFPSYVLPDNLRPPYGAVHIDPR